MKLALRIISGLLLVFVLLAGSGITQQAYNLIEGNGTAVARGSTLNFPNTASVTWSCSTSGGVTSCSAASTGSGGGYTTIQNNGTSLPQEPILNFTSGVTCVDDSGTTSTNCSASGSGGGGFIQPLTAPVTANFTSENFNVGTGVVTTRSNNSSPVASLSMVQYDPNLTNQIAAVDKPKLAATFTATVALSALSVYPNGASQSVRGMWLSDGSANCLIFGYAENTGGLVIFTYTSFAGAGVSISLNTTIGLAGSTFLQWLRIQETASARNYYVSVDGVLWILVFTESNTAHFTTANYGMAAQDRNSAGWMMMNLYSLAESNP